MTQPRLSNKEIEIILNDVYIRDTFTDGRFLLYDEADRVLVQIRFMATNHMGGPLVEQKCRKWTVSRYSTKSEIVQTAFKAAMSAVEHELRENFRYRDHPVFSPHFNVDAMVTLCEERKYDIREG